MLKIREKSSEFLVYIYTQDADLGAQVKLRLSLGKYQAFYFANFEELENRMSEDIPHIVVMDIETLLISPSEAFESLLTFSSEIKFVLLARSEQLESLEVFKDYNLLQVFERAQQGVAFQVLNAVDEGCETLYRIYQNEHIYQMFKSESEQSENLKTLIEQERFGPEVRPFQNRIAVYRTAESKDDLLQKFFQQTPQQSWVFLKYIKSIQTYIAVSYQNMPENWVEGISFKIPISEEEFNQQLMLGSIPESLVAYLNNKWSTLAIKVLPLLLKDEVEGLMVTTQDVSAEVAEDFSLMGLVYNILVLESKPSYSDVEDQLTGFYNRLFYSRILEKEIDRCKRTLSPLSIIKISLDAYNEIEISQGKVFCQEIIKKIADMIKKTSRLPDYACRTGENEFSLVLTNCNRKGAALRAERLRQALKNENFSKTGIVVTVSQGISEYPTLTKSAIMLDESAKKALDFISSKGTDKICIYKAPRDHQPDFQVNA